MYCGRTNNAPARLAHGGGGRSVARHAQCADPDSSRGAALSGGAFFCGQCRGAPGRAGTGLPAGLVVRPCRRFGLSVLGGDSDPRGGRPALAPGRAMRPGARRVHRFVRRSVRGAGLPDPPARGRRPERFRSRRQLCPPSCLLVRLGSGGARPLVRTHLAPARMGARLVLHRLPLAFSGVRLCAVAGADSGGVPGWKLRPQRDHGRPCVPRAGGRGPVRNRSGHDGTDSTPSGRNPRLNDAGPGTPEAPGKTGRARGNGLRPASGVRHVAAPPPRNRRQERRERQTGEGNRRRTGTRQPCRCSR